MAFQKLFKPIKIGKLELRNRIIFAPIGIGAYNLDESVNKIYFSFIKERALETALIITQGTRPSNKFGGVKMIGTYDDKFIPSLKKFADSAHTNGAKIFIQSVMIGGNDPFGGYAPSVVDIPLYRNQWGRGSKFQPKELSLYQIKELVEEFAQGARRAREAGFDGIEVHGAYGYLISEFIWEGSNRRTDEYGGSFENRLRFPIEIIRRIKKLCGEDFPIGFKFNAYMSTEPLGFFSEELGIKIAKRIAEEGVVYLHPVTFGEDVMKKGLEKYPHFPNVYQPRNTTIVLTENLKRHIKNVPIIAAGGILDPYDADRIITEGKADMVAIGRALLADPHWSCKAKTGKRIVPCIKCIICHHEVVVKAKVAECSVNPYLCKEKEMNLDKVKIPKKVVIVGAGPAGINAALTASKRGHHVTLYEKDGDVGGMIKPSTVLGFKYEFDTLLSFYKKEIEHSDIKLVTGEEVGPKLIKNLNADVLILAIGGQILVPKIKGINQENVFPAVECLCGKHKIESGSNIVVIGGGEVGCETALWLSRKGNNVSIIEILYELMAHSEIKYHTMVLESLLKEEGVSSYLKSNVL